MLERKKRFAHYLLNHVRGLHQDFLKSLVPPLNINDNKLTRSLLIFLFFHFLFFSRILNSFCFDSKLLSRSNINTICLRNLKSPPHILRWHPEFDLNGLTLPPPGTVPESPDSKSIMSASVMLHSIDSNRAQPPPGVSKTQGNIL